MTQVTDRIFKFTQIMFQWFLRFAEFARFSEFNETSAPLRKNTIVQVGLNKDIGNYDISYQKV